VNFGLHQAAGAATTTITGVVFDDVNRNGRRDTGEAGIAGVTVFLDLNDNNRLDTGEPSAVTAADGSYTLVTTATTRTHGGEDDDQQGNDDDQGDENGDGRNEVHVRVVRPAGFVRTTDEPEVQLTGGTVTAADIGLAAKPVRPPVIAPADARFAVGAVVNGAAHVLVFGADGKQITDLDVSSFAGAVQPRVATGDVTGDGVDDVIVGTGPGVANRIEVFDGRTFQPVFSTQPFEPTYTGGVFVAAGDVTRDGIADVIVAPDEGGGPRVEVFQGGTAGFPLVANFFGIDDDNFRGGARVTVADLNGDGTPDLIVAAGSGGGPRIAFFDGLTVVAENGRGVGGLRKLFNDIFVFEQTLRDGVFVSAGDFDGDGFADLAVGGGPGGGPRVLVLSGKDLSGGNLADPTAIANFFAGDDTKRGGVRVAAKDLDGDGVDDLITGDGTGSGTQVSTFSGPSLHQNKTPLPEHQFDADRGDNNGVFVG
jgi:hypothetical protein